MAKVVKKGVTISLGLIFFLAFYPLKLARHVYGKLFDKSPENYTGIHEVFAETFCSIEDALKVALPGSQTINKETKSLSEEQKKIIAKKAEIEFDPELDKGYYNFFIAQTGGEVNAYAIEDTVKGRWGNIHYIMSLDLLGKVKDVVILELKEKLGRSIKEHKFLGQYIRKSVSDKIKLNQDIKGIAGATISSRVMTNGIRKLVYIFNELYKK